VDEFTASSLPSTDYGSVHSVHISRAGNFLDNTLQLPASMPTQVTLVAEARRRRPGDLMVKPEAVLCKMAISLPSPSLLYFL
jgi:hypothetical protein